MKKFLLQVAFIPIRLLAFLPLSVLYVFSDGLYLLAYYVVRYRRRVVRVNLEKSFPEKSSQEIIKIEKQFYHFICDLVFEVIRLIEIPKEEIRRRIKFSDPEFFESLYSQGKDAFMLAPHYCNWEWLSTMEGTVSHHAVSLYRPLQNKAFERLFRWIRSRFGTDLVPSLQAPRAILKYKGENRRIMLCFLADQSPQRHLIQHWTKFMHQDTPVYLGAEKLAKHHHAAAGFMCIRRIKRGYYRVDTKLLALDAATTPPYEITDRYMQMLEEVLREEPQYWLWTHRRWKHKREETKK